MSCIMIQEGGLSLLSWQADNRTFLCFVFIPPWGTCILQVLYILIITGEYIFFFCKRDHYVICYFCLWYSILLTIHIERYLIGYNSGLIGF